MNIGRKAPPVPTSVQDLSFWLPLLLVAAVWLWHRRPWGFLLAGAGLVYWVLEGVTVATDQASATAPTRRRPSSRRRRSPVSPSSPPSRWSPPSPSCGTSTGAMGAPQRPDGPGRSCIGLRDSREALGMRESRFAAASLPSAHSCPANRPRESCRAKPPPGTRAVTDQRGIIRPARDAGAGARGDSGSIGDESSGAAGDSGGRRAAELEETTRRAQLVQGNIGSVILGKQDVIESCVVALLAGRPRHRRGLPRASARRCSPRRSPARSAAASRASSSPPTCSRATSPASTCSTSRATTFEFRPGPVFANVVLADEINRASPKTQSSLLECMEERQATIDNVTHHIARPFMVIATQNPIEYEGTYPLPEAQLDRFMMRLESRLPDQPRPRRRSSTSQTSGDPLARARPGRDGGGRARRCSRRSCSVRVAPALRRYVVDPGRGDARAPGHLPRAPARAPASPSCARPRRSPSCAAGTSWCRRTSRTLAVRVLSHRIILSAEAGGRARAEEAVITRLLEAVPAPGPGR